MTSMGIHRLEVGDHVIVGGGYDMDPPWLAASVAGYQGRVVSSFLDRTGLPQRSSNSPRNWCFPMAQALLMVSKFAVTSWSWNSHMVERTGRLRHRVYILSYVTSGPRPNGGRIAVRELGSSPTRPTGSFRIPTAANVSPA